MKKEELYENLLSAWLRMSAGVRNERLVRTMTFNEVFVCNIVYGATINEEQSVTATDICERTGMYKSQANKVLVSLEEEGLLARVRSKDDKRKMILRLTERGMEKYLAEHANVLLIIEAVANKLGAEKTKQVAELLTEVAEFMWEQEGI